MKEEEELLITRVYKTPTKHKTLTAALLRTTNERDYLATFDTLILGRCAIALAGYDE
jgi:hypothetical protein